MMYLSFFLILFTIFLFTLYKKALNKLSGVYYQFESLSFLINEVTKGKDSNEILEISLKHLTESKVFKMQFAVINIIDPFEKRVEQWIPSKTFYDEIQHQFWRSTDKYGDEILSLPENDIILVIARSAERKIVKVVGEQIIVIEGSNDTLIELDKRVTESYNHIRFTRLFMPLWVELSKNEKFVKGVIEMGYVTNSKYDIKINDELILKTKIYIDNFVQVYHKLYVKEKIDKLQLEIDKIKNQDDYKNYLSEAIKILTLYFNCKKGEIDIIPLDSDLDSWIPNINESQKFGISENETHVLRNKNTSPSGKTILLGVYREVFRKNETIVVNDVSICEYYIPGYNNICSQISTPFSNNEISIGVLTIYSKHKNFFNSFIKESLESITKQICDTYLRKKTNYILRKLSLPLNIFQKKDDIYISTLDIINEYFCLNNILLFVETEAGKNEIFTNLKESNSIVIKFDKKEKDFKNEIIIDEIKTNKIIYYNFLKKKKNNGLFGYLVIPSKIWYTISEEDKIFLYQCTNRLSSTLEFMDFFKAFFYMPISVAKGNIQLVYREIEISAKRFFDASPVLLFKLYNGEKFSMARLSESEDLLFKIPEINKELENNESNMINKVVKNELILVSNEEEYNKHWKDRGWKVGEFEQDFYKREKIVSFAGIRIDYQGNHLAVLFLNFKDSRYRNGFPLDFKNKLKTFSILVAQSIEYAKLVEENNIIRHKNFKANKPFIDSLILLGLIHGIENNFNALENQFNFFITNIKDPNLLNKSEFILKPLISLKSTIDTFRKFRNTKGESFRFEDVYLYDLLKETIDLIKVKCDNNNIELQYDLAKSKSILLNVDINSVKHIILNFIYNAIESIVDKGQRRKIIRIDYENKNSKVEIKISDSGPGIDPHIRPKLFEAYETTKSYGTGMGLNISKYLAEVNKGTIDFYDFASQSGGVWTTFSLKLETINNSIYKKDKPTS